MIIYIEKDAKDYATSKNILSKFKDAQILEISNHKNIFDKNIPSKSEKCLILARLR